VDERGRLFVEALLEVALVAVLRVELVLQRHDLLVALVEALREEDHNVALLEEELLLAVDLRLFLLDRLALLLELREASVLLGADALLVLLERRAEGGHLLDRARARRRARRAAGRGDRGEHVGLERLDAVLEALLLRLLAHEFARARLERADRGHLVLLRAAALLVELEEAALVDDGARALLELGAEALELALLLAEERLLVEVLVHARLVLDVLRAVRELERRERLDEGLSRWSGGGWVGGWVRG
jgi:hypothetical protein